MTRDKSGKQNSKNRTTSQTPVMDFGFNRKSPQSLVFVSLFVSVTDEHSIYATNISVLPTLCSYLRINDEKTKKIGEIRFKPLIAH